MARPDCFVCEDGNPVIPFTLPPCAVISMIAFVVIERKIRDLVAEMEKMEWDVTPAEVFETLVSREVSDHQIFNEGDFRKLFEDFFNECSGGMEFVLITHHNEFIRAAKDLLKAGIAALDSRQDFLERMAVALAETYGKPHGKCFLRWLRCGMEKVPFPERCN